MWLADERELTIEESKEGISQLSQQRPYNLGTCLLDVELDEKAVPELFSEVESVVDCVSVAEREGGLSVLLVLDLFDGQFDGGLALQPHHHCLLQWVTPHHTGRA